MPMPIQPMVTVACASEAGEGPQPLFRSQTLHALMNQ
jgi:hypothetical protein